MRYWDNGHMDGGWGTVMTLAMLGIWVLLAAAVVLAVVWAVRSTAGSRTTSAGSSAEQILAERLARGDIDAEEYHERLAVLTSTAGGAAGPT